MGLHAQGGRSLRELNSTERVGCECHPNREFLATSWPRQTQPCALHVSRLREATFISSTSFHYSEPLGILRHSSTNHEPQGCPVLEKSRSSLPCHFLVASRLRCLPVCYIWFATPRCIPTPTTGQASRVCERRDAILFNGSYEGRIKGESASAQ